MRPLRLILLLLLACLPGWASSQEQVASVETLIENTTLESFQSQLERQVGALTDPLDRYQFYRDLGRSITYNHLISRPHIEFETVYKWRHVGIEFLKSRFDRRPELNFAERANLYSALMDARVGEELLARMDKTKPRLHPRSAREILIEPGTNNKMVVKGGTHELADALFAEAEKRLGDSAELGWFIGSVVEVLKNQEDYQKKIGQRFLLQFIEKYHKAGGTAVLIPAVLALEKLGDSHSLQTLVYAPKFLKLNFSELKAQGLQASKKGPEFLRLQFDQLLQERPDLDYYLVIRDWVHRIEEYYKSANRWMALSPDQKTQALLSLLELLGHPNYRARALAFSLLRPFLLALSNATEMARYHHCSTQNSNPTDEYLLLKSIEQYLTHFEPDLEPLDSGVNSVLAKYIVARPKWSGLFR